MLSRRVVRAAARPAAARTLLLDLDGTLAPIAPTPAEARVPSETLTQLRRLVAGAWNVAIVSGRGASQVRRLVPVRGVRVFGSHGLEGSWRGGRAARLSARTRAQLAALARGGKRLAAGTRGVAVERKPAGVAFHDRLVPTAGLARWRRRLRDWLAAQPTDGLETLRGRRVVELRPCGVHKGLIVVSLPRPKGAPRPDDSLVAIGDDRTDEDMFRELEGRGLAIRVGSPRRRSLARHRLPSPLAVQRFLRLLADRTER